MPVDLPALNKSYVRPGALHLRDGKVSFCIDNIKDKVGFCWSGVVMAAPLQFFIEYEYSDKRKIRGIVPLNSGYRAVRKIF